MSEQGESYGQQPRPVHRVGAAVSCALQRPVVRQLEVGGVLLAVRAIPYGLFRRVRDARQDDLDAMADLMAEIVEACVERIADGAPVDAMALDVTTLAELAKAAMPSPERVPDKGAEAGAEEGAEEGADFPKPPGPCASGGCSGSARPKSTQRRRG